MARTNTVPLTDVEREEYREVAWELKAEGLSQRKIADKLGMTPRTIRGLLEEEQRIRRASNAGQSHSTLAISRYERIIERSFGLLDILPITSNNIGSCLKAVIDAQGKIDEITGVKAPVRKEVKSRIEQIDLSTLTEEELNMVDTIMSRAGIAPDGSVN